MKKLFIIATLLLASCTARDRQQLDRSWQFTSRYYTVTVYSGGKPIKVYTFKGIINQEEHTDGIYFYDSNNKLTEISGDYIIESTNFKPTENTNDFTIESDTAAKAAN